MGEAVVRRSRVVAGALVAAIMLGMSTACVRTETCVSWVDFETPQDAYDEAALVVIAEVTGSAGSRDIYGAPAPVHAVRIAEVLKGDDSGPVIDVASTPVTCTGDVTQPDPLDVSGEVILFLNDPKDFGGWGLMTPFDGVLPLPADGALPFELADR